MVPQTLFHRLQVNERGRDFIVGDIHGHASLLEQISSVSYFDAADSWGFSLAAAAMCGRTRIHAWALSAQPELLARTTPDRLAKVKAALTPVTGIDWVIAGHTVLSKFKPVAVSNP